MTRKLKEAAVKIDISGLETNDLTELARMMELAGQIDVSSQNVQPDLSQGISALDINAPSTDLGMDTGIESSFEEPVSTEPDLSQGVSMVGDSEPASDISPDETVDISMSPDLQSESDSLGDVVGQDDISNETDSMFEDAFDMARMSSLAGLTEDISDDDDNMDNESSDEDSDAEDLDEARLLPDLSLNEGPEEFGPFRTEQECEMNGQMETNGVSGNNFIVMSKPDGYYWKRTVQEDVVNRPEPHEVNTDGIENSRHEFRHKRTKLGDNTILSDIHESTEDDEDEESVEQIHESLNERYKQFLGGM
ncbi:hypothetical protein XaC1_284 [Xanthomonas phage XaC1]|nr:hypothetical protein XaC1_284 [Xanthomonas phage XaC1]